MALSKAEASAGSVEAAWSKSARVTIVALLVLIVVALYLVILALSLPFLISIDRHHGRDVARSDRTDLKRA